MPEESDCIIDGPREINFFASEEEVLGSSPKINDSLLSKVEISIPIDQEKSADAEERVKRYRIQRQKEIKQEQEELIKRNQAQQQQLGQQNPMAYSLDKDVGNLVHPSQNAKDGTSSQQAQGAAASVNNQRNPKSRSNMSAIQACTEVIGYLPKRGDFDQEYDMDAELLLADMEFFDEDTEEQIQLKNSVIELYNARV